MSLIKPRTRGKQLVRLITRLDRQTAETVYAYAAFIGEDAEYVLNQLVDTVLAKDREFVRWRADHPESYVLTSRRRRRRAGTAPVQGPTLSEAPPEGARPPSVVN